MYNNIILVYYFVSRSCQYVPQKTTDLTITELKKREKIKNLLYRHITNEIPSNLHTKKIVVFT